MILGILSLPTPLSPVTKTEISVGATRIAFSITLFKFGSFPIIPKRCFVACTDSIILPREGGDLIFVNLYLFLVIH